MKRIVVFLTVLSVLLLAGSFSVYGETVSADVEFRAAWVSSVLNLDYPSKPGLSNAELKKEADAIMDKAVDLGLNALMLQVRPTGDALYKSDIFPWSEYLTGKQGLAPADGFDPLQYWIEEAHKRGIEIHAWINPYRVSHSTKNRTDVKELSANNPARLNPSLVKVYDRAIYYDPGIPECKQLIIDGIVEIIENYDVDGIHLDDYFYPASSFDDADTFEKYGAGERRKDNWRRENVNDLIKGIQQAIKERRPDVRFGVSPAGVWQNLSTHPLGSDTRGFESYSAIFSDSRRWVKEGWLDYICPQIYWYIGYAQADYSTLLSWWTDVCKDTGVDLYIGHGAYREAEKQANWEGEMLRQLTLNSYFEEVKGSVFFRMLSISGSVASSIKDFYTGQKYSEPTVKMETLSVVQPSSNVTLTGAKGYYFFGSCDPAVGLYVNGYVVENRTAEGFFSVYCPLWTGSNVFTFTQEGQANVVRTVTVKEPVAVVPSPTKEPMKINDIPASTPYYATVTSNSAWAYPGNTTTGGSSWQLVKGQKDKITGVTADEKWIRLSSGQWVEKSDVSIAMEQSLVTNVLSNGVYKADAKEYTDVITWKAAAHPVANVTYSGNTLTLYLGMQTELPALDLIGLSSMDGTIFTLVSGNIENGLPYYKFRINSNVKIEGFYTEYSNGEFSLNIKKRREPADGNLPLAGFSFVVDAGHGLSEIGAKGPMGTAYPEKDINLAISQKLAKNLRALGADVTMTRNSDSALTLFERTEVSRAVNPDMFISIHSNSLDETADATNVRGLTVWYRNVSSKDLAASLMSKLHKVNPFSNRRIEPNQSNFYVCRPSWTPSVIIESSFVNNIHDFAWLINNDNQDELAEKIAAAILSYYSE